MICRPDTSEGKPLHVSFRNLAAGGGKVGIASFAVSNFSWLRSWSFARNIPKHLLHQNKFCPNAINAQGKAECFLRPPSVPQCILHLHFTGRELHWSEQCALHLHLPSRELHLTEGFGNACEACSRVKFATDLGLRKVTFFSEQVERTRPLEVTVFGRTHDGQESPHPNQQQ